MSVNKKRPHVLVLPEDDANRELAKEFHLQVPPNRQRQMQVLSVARGWIRVMELFQSVHVAEMERNPQRFMILLIDFDGLDERLSEAKAQVPPYLTDRVFVLGALTTPEALKQANLGHYRDIASAMAKDCREGTNSIWGHELLQHNEGELNRLRGCVLPILFPSSE